MQVRPSNSRIATEESIIYLEWALEMLKVGYRYGYMTCSDGEPASYIYS